jgi:putative spermidine/putrescine transport system substrate-binding protein
VAKRATTNARPSAGVGRRRFLLGTAAAAGAASWPLILTPGLAKAANKIVFALWGGNYQEAMETAFLKPFTKETGIEVVVAGAPDMAKVRAQIKSKTIEWDLIIPTQGWVTAGEKESLWEPLDFKQIDMSDTMKGAKRDHAIAYITVAGGIGFSDERNGAPGKHPETFLEFWDPAKFPGRRGLRSRPSEMLEMALLGDGVPPDKVYPMDVDRAFKALDKIKPHVNQWIAATPKTIELILQNETDFTYTYNGRVWAFRAKQGLPINFSYKQNLLFMDFITMLRGSPNRNEAMKLVAFIMRPEQQTLMGNAIAYSPTKLKAIDKCDPEVKKFFPDMNNPNHLNVTLHMDWWTDKEEDLQKRFKEWQIS